MCAKPNFSIFPKLMASIRHHFVIPLGETHMDLVNAAQVVMAAAAVLAVLIEIIRLADDKPGILRRTGTKLAVSMRYVWEVLARKLQG